MKAELWLLRRIRKSRLQTNNVQRIELTGGRWLNGRMVKKHDLAGEVA